MSHYYNFHNDPEFARVGVDGGVHIAGYLKPFLHAVV